MTTKLILADGITLTSKNDIDITQFTVTYNDDDNNVRIVQFNKMKILEASIDSQTVANYPTGYETTEDRY